MYPVDGMRFRVIAADPPWPYPATGQPGGFGDNVRTYRHGDRLGKSTGWSADGKVLSIEQLCSATIPTMDDSCLFLWCTASNMPSALKVMEAWEFRYKTCLIWVKTNKDCATVRSTALGYWSYVVHELLLFGIKGKFQRNTKAAPFKSVFMEPFPRGHGYKPDIIYQKIQDAYAGPHLELFATKRRLGWFAYGNEVESGSDITIPEWEAH